MSRTATAGVLLLTAASFEWFADVVNPTGRHGGDFTQSVSQRFHTAWGDLQELAAPYGAGLRAGISPAGPAGTQPITSAGVSTAHASSDALGSDHPDPEVTVEAPASMGDVRASGEMTCDCSCDCGCAAVGALPMEAEVGVTSAGAAAAGPANVCGSAGFQDGRSAGGYGHEEEDATVGSDEIHAADNAARPDAVSPTEVAPSLIKETIESGAGADASADADADIHTTPPVVNVPSTTIEARDGDTGVHVHAAETDVDVDIAAVAAAPARIATPAPAGVSPLQDVVETARDGTPTGGTPSLRTAAALASTAVFDLLLYATFSRVQAAHNDENPETWSAWGLRQATTSIAVYLLTVVAVPLFPGGPGNDGNWADVGMAAPLTAAAVACSLLFAASRRRTTREAQQQQPAPQTADAPPAARSNPSRSPAVASTATDVDASAAAVEQTPPNPSLCAAEPCAAGGSPQQLPSRGVGATPNESVYSMSAMVPPSPVESVVLFDRSVGRGLGILLASEGAWTPGISPQAAVPPASVRGAPTDGDTESCGVSTEVCTPARSQRMPSQASTPVHVTPSRHRSRAYGTVMLERARAETRRLRDANAALREQLGDLSARVASARRRGSDEDTPSGDADSVFSSDSFLLPAPVSPPSLPWRPVGRTI